MTVPPREPGGEATTDTFSLDGEWDLAPHDVDLISRQVGAEAAQEEGSPGGARKGGHDWAAAGWGTGAPPAARGGASTTYKQAHTTPRCTQC
jgi:hypothetical protein